MCSHRPECDAFVARIHAANPTSRHILRAWPALRAHLDGYFVRNERERSLFTLMLYLIPAASG